MTTLRTTATPSLASPPITTLVPTKSGRQRLQGLERGMIFWVEVPLKSPSTGPVQEDETTDVAVGSEQGKERPWVIVSAASIHRNLPVAHAVPLTSQAHKAGVPFRIQISKSSITRYRVPKLLDDTDQLALTEQVRTLAHERLVLKTGPIGQVSTNVLKNLSVGLAYVLDIC